MGAEVRRIDEALELRARRLRGETRRDVRVERSFSKQEIAANYGVSPKTIDDWCRLGMPWFRVGSRRKFRLSETDPWMRETGKMD